MCDLATASQSVDFIDDDEEVKAEELGILQCVLWIILLLIGVEVVLFMINNGRQDKIFPSMMKSITQARCVGYSMSAI